MPGAARGKLPILLLCAAGFVPHLLYALSSRGFLLAHSVTDDTFYYLKVAQNAWDKGLFFSFDGIHLTNGFHPLYQVILIGLYPLVGGEFAFVRAAIILCAAFHVLAGLLLFRLMDREFGRIPAYLTLTLWLFNIWAVRMATYAMETALASMMLAATLWYLSRVIHTGGWNYRRLCLLGLLAGLTFLARLEVGVFLGMLLGVYLFIQSHGIGRVACPAVFGLCLTAVGGTFLVYNYATFGRLGTISSATKSSISMKSVKRPNGGIDPARFITRGVRNTAVNAVKTTAQFFSAAGFPALAFCARKYPSFEHEYGGVSRFLRGVVIPRPLPLFAWFAVLLAAFLIAAVAASRWKLAEKVADPVARLPVPVLLLFCLAAAHVAACSFILGNHTGEWYWGAESVAFTVLCGMAVTWRPVRTPVMAGVSALIFSGVVFYATVFLALHGGASPLRAGYEERSWLGSCFESITWMRRNLPADARVCSFNAGARGYFSGRCVINIDGLVNDFEFFEYRDSRRINEYIRKNGIRYFSDAATVEGTREYHKTIGLPDTAFKPLFRSSYQEDFVEEIVGGW